MKKLLLITILLATTVAALTQERALPPKERINQAVLVSIDADDSRDCLSPLNIKNTFLPMLAPNEQDIGITVFDSQTNRLLAHRFYRYEDGTMGAVWTMGMEDPDFPDRGTGYNYYNGTEWGPVPTSRIESFRAGWPSYAPFGNNGEMFFSHEFGQGEVYYHTREIKGTGDWTENLFSYTPGPDGVSHAKVITTGPENKTIHLLVNSFTEYLGQSLAVLYSRSQDGGLTWDFQNVVLEGTGIDYYTAHNRDKFAFAEENGGVIALICGDIWADLFMMKSTDNGDTWEKTVIWKHPYPFFDWDVTLTDTFFCMDNSAGIALDAQGKAHVVFGINRVLHDAPGGQYWLWPAVDGIAYWNEDMETFSDDIHALAPPDYGYANSEMISDQNYIGWMQDVNGNGTIDLNNDIFFYSRHHGASTMPTITIDDQERIFVIYSSTTETYEYENYNYKHLWARAFDNGKWGPFVDLTEDIAHIYDECIHPQLASSSDEYIHYIYHVDNIPGEAQRGDHGFHETRITYGSFPKNDLLTGTAENQTGPIHSLNLKVYPNPSIGVFNLSYHVPEKTTLTITITDAQGRVIDSISLEALERGKNDKTLNLSHLPDGVYLLRLQAGDVTETGKVVLRK